MANNVGASLATPPIPSHAGTTLPSPDQPSLRDQVQERNQRRMVALAASGFAAVALILFTVVARVPIAAGWRQDRSLRVREIWALFTQELAAIAGTWLSPLVISVVVGIILGGCVVALGLALMVTDEPPDARGD